MANGQLSGTFRFSLMIDNVTIARFTEVSGLSAEIKTEIIREGGRNDYVIELPSSVSYPRLVLKAGMVDTELRDWFMEFRNKGTITRKNITITLYGDLDAMNYQKVIYEWHIIDAFPVKWNGPTLNAMTSALAFESIEFIHKGLYRANEGKSNQTAIGSL